MFYPSLFLWKVSWKIKIMSRSKRLFPVDSYRCFSLWLRLHFTEVWFIIVFVFIWEHCVLSRPSSSTPVLSSFDLPADTRSVLEFQPWVEASKAILTELQAVCSITSELPLSHQVKTRVHFPSSPREQCFFKIFPIISHVFSHSSVELSMASRQKPWQRSWNLS